MNKIQWWVLVFVIVNIWGSLAFLSTQIDVHNVGGWHMLWKTESEIYKRFDRIEHKLDRIDLTLTASALSTDHQLIKIREFSANAFFSHPKFDQTRTIANEQLLLIIDDAKENSYFTYLDIGIRKRNQK